MVEGGAALPLRDVVPPGPFPDEFPDGHSRVSRAWDLSRLLPMPTTAHRCPFCAGVLAVKDWRFHVRERVGSQSPWRCDVRLKCMSCGFVPTFGVLVSRDMYDRAAAAFTIGRWIHWRAGRKAMEEGS